MFGISYFFQRTGSRVNYFFVNGLASGFHFFIQSSLLVLYTTSQFLGNHVRHVLGVFPVFLPEGLLTGDGLKKQGNYSDVLPSYVGDVSNRFQVLMVVKSEVLSLFIKGAGVSQHVEEVQSAFH